MLPSAEQNTPGWENNPTLEKNNPPNNFRAEEIKIKPQPAKSSAQIEMRYV